MFSEAIEFFVYDSVKILLLLLVINYIMAAVRYYLPLEKIREFLHSRKWYGADYLLGAFFGAITPFCSCSSIPLFVGFLGAGIPVGVTFTFLITSPLINEAAIALFIGLFGWKVTLMYVGAGLALGILGGLILSKTNVKKYINPDILQTANHVSMNTAPQRASISKKNLLKLWFKESLAFTKKLALYVLAGVAVGAIIHGYVPQNFFEGTLINNAWWTVPLAALVAVPLYSNAVGVIPIMQALVIKGVPIGTALAFMMATVGLSFPEALILKKIMKLKLLAIYFGIVTVGIIVIGYVLNIFFG